MFHTLQETLIHYASRPAGLPMVNDIIRNKEKKSARKRRQTRRLFGGDGTGYSEISIRIQVDRVSCRGTHCRCSGWSDQRPS
jgi:hypothetical protein